MKWLLIIGLCAMISISNVFCDVNVLSLEIMPPDEVPAVHTNEVIDNYNYNYDSVPSGLSDYGDFAFDTYIRLKPEDFKFVPYVPIGEGQDETFEESPFKYDIVTSQIKKNSADEKTKLTTKEELPVLETELIPPLPEKYKHWITLEGGDEDELEKTNKQTNKNKQNKEITDEKEKNFKEHSE